jgi:hypothetical protein
MFDRQRTSTKRWYFNIAIHSSTPYSNNICLLFKILYLAQHFVSDQFNDHLGTHCRLYPLACEKTASLHGVLRNIGFCNKIMFKCGLAVQSVIYKYGSVNRDCSDTPQSGNMVIRLTLAATLFATAYSLKDNCPCVRPNWTLEIPANASDSDILCAASKLWPTETQIHEQKNEMIGFTHFGVNTYTGLESK